MNSFKYCMGLGVVLLGVTVIAAEVKITSFNYTGTRTRSAELCGIVEADVSPLAVVDVIVDPNYKNPGKYAVIVAQDGQFCTVVNTLTGNADVTLRGGSQKNTAQIK